MEIFADGEFHKWSLSNPTPGQAFSSPISSLLLDLEKSSIHPSEWNLMENAQDLPMKLSFEIKFLCICWGTMS